MHENAQNCKKMQILTKNNYCRSVASEASEGTTLNTETIKRFSDR